MSDSSDEEDSSDEDVVLLDEEEAFLNEKRYFRTAGKWIETN
jgi:hypothetical protein